MLLKTFVGFLFLLISICVQADPIFSSATVKFTGDAYIDTSLPDETRGIGRISTIVQGSNVLWSSGDSGNFINFVFGGYTPVVSPTAPIFNFQADNGFVDFYLNTAGVFNTQQAVDTSIADISAGNLLLSTIAHGPTVGIATNVTYSANGFLDVTGGLFNWLFDTNSRLVFAPNEFADMSFGLVGSNNQSTLVNENYQYIVSADMQGSSVASPVPLPAAIWTMLAGLVAMTSFSRRSV